jgi:hypothetical protein
MEGQVRLSAEDPSVQCSLVVYSQPVFGSAIFTFPSPKFKLPPIPNKPPGACITVLVYVRNAQSTDSEQRVLGPDEKTEARQDYLMRLGTAVVPIASLTSGTYEVYDLSGVSVGKLDLQVPPDRDDFGELQSQVAKKRAPAMSELVTDVRKQLAGLEQHYKWTSGAGDASRYVDQWMSTHFSFVDIKQHCGAVPMAAYLPLNTSEDSKADVGYLRNALNNARYLMRLQQQPLKELSVEQLAELAKEMQVLPMLAQQYRIDYTKHFPGDYKPLDKWENSFVTPDPELQSFDCEDGCIRIYQETVWLRNSTDPTLKPLVDLERRYVTFLSAMLLKLPGPERGKDAYTYHAAILKLDRSYVLAKLGLNNRSE